jgi:hypothetical protein
LLDLETVKEYQALVNSHGLDVDLESSEMLFKVLEKSTESSLWQMLKQTYVSCWHPAKQGGVSMFKLLMDKLDNPSFEQLQNGVNYTSSHSNCLILQEKTYLTPLCASLPSSRASRPPRSLPKQSTSSSKACYIVEMMTLGMLSRFSMASCSLSGKQLAREPVLVQLDTVGSPLIEKYNALIAVNMWGAVGSKASAFKAGDRGGAPLNP